MLNLQLYVVHEERKLSMKNEEINLRSNCAYESRESVSRKVNQLKATRNILSQNKIQIITEPNEVYEPCKIIKPGLLTD